MKYTISDIARMANVSKATVSRVINNKTEGVGEQTAARIRDLIDQLGYRPNSLARSIVVSQSKTLGLVIPDIKNPFFPDLVRGIEDYANANGYTVFLCNSDNDPDKEERYLLSFIDRRVDGIILATSNTYSAALEKLREYGVPFVLVDRPLNGGSADSGVYADNYKGVQLAAAYLIKNGSRRIAFLGGTRRVVSTMERFNGYRDALKEAGYEMDKALVKFGDYSIEAGERMTEELLESGERFDAVVAGCDLIAVGVVKALKRHGVSLPEDCELIGFDGIELAEIFDPAISTVSQPIYEIATEAAKLLIGKIQGDVSCSRKVVFEPTLRLRATTRPEGGGEG